jgi:4-hydroxy-3-polyprenylbenzoate decarboxylase
MGLVLGTDPDEGHSDVTIHRLCVQGRDELSIFFAPDRHIDVFRKKAESRGQALPVTINMGLDPAIHIGACFEAPTTPFGYDELAIAGGLRGKPVELVEAVIKVKAVTMRHGAILQTLVGPGEEHTSLAGIPTEASIYKAVQAAMPGFVQQVYAHTAGGGKLLAVLQVKKSRALDDGRARQAALIAFAAYAELKHVIVVDDDVDPFDSDDVLWAMTTRFQGDMSTMLLPKVNGHVLDPSQSPEFNPALPARGVTCKMVFDCTAPFALREEFKRAQFKEVDPRPFAPALFDALGESDE